MKSAIHWFELPATDLARAQAFYEAVLATTLTATTFGGMAMAIFPYTQGAGVGGALVKDPRFVPSQAGALVYLDAGGALDACLARVPAAGGRVLMEKTDIGEPGFIAVVQDTEGNRVGLHMPRA